MFFSKFPQAYRPKEDKLQNPDDHHIPVVYRTKGLYDKQSDPEKYRFEEEGRNRSKSTLN